MTGLPEAEKAARLQRLAACRGVTHVAMMAPDERNVLASLAAPSERDLAGPQPFSWTARNPWSRGGAYSLVVRRFSPASAEPDTLGAL